MWGRSILGQALSREFALLITPLTRSSIRMMRVWGIIGEICTASFPTIHLLTFIPAPIICVSIVWIPSLVFVVVHCANAEQWKMCSWGLLERLQVWCYEALYFRVPSKQCEGSSILRNLGLHWCNNCYMRYNNLPPQPPSPISWYFPFIPTL